MSAARVITLKPTDFLRVQNYQIYDGPSPIKDLTSRAYDEFDFPFNGGESHSNLFEGFKQRRQQAQARKNLKTKSKAQARVMKAGATQTKADAKLETAKANQIAAKGLSQPDAQQNNIRISKDSKEGMSTGAKVAIAVGVVALIVVGVIVVKKMRKKGK